MRTQISIDEVVNAYISEAMLTSAHYLRLYQIAVRGLVELQLDIIASTKTVKLDVSSSKTVPFPDHFVDWIKFGILNDQGEVMTLRKNNNLTKYKSTDVNRLSNNTDASNGVINIDLGSNVYANYYQQGTMVNLFGVGAAMTYNGMFAVDEPNGVFLLDNEYQKDYIILEYLEDPRVATDLTIPLQAQEALISWLRWKDIESMPPSRRSNIGEKQIRRKEYYNQRRLLRTRLNPLRISDFNETVRLNNRLILKS